MNPESYIRAAFESLLGPALATTVRFDVVYEVWHVYRNGRHYTMPVTSDDDCFRFTCKIDATSITIEFPFLAE